MEELKLTFVNVGYGEAALLECPDPAFPGGTFVMVIDGGSAEAEEYRDSATGRIPLDQYLSLRGVDHIDLMAATMSMRTTCAACCPRRRSCLPRPSGRRCPRSVAAPCGRWTFRRRA